MVESPFLAEGQMLSGAASQAMEQWGGPSAVVEEAEERDLTKRGI